MTLSFVARKGTRTIMIRTEICFECLRLQRLLRNHLLLEMRPFHSVADKSLPVHCIVETILSLEEQNDREKNNWRRKSNVEVDSYVIIPVNTPIQELVLVALTRLGYPKETAAAAKGERSLSNLFCEQDKGKPISGLKERKRA